MARADMFQLLNKISEISNQEEFEDSDFDGVDRLLGVVDYTDLGFALNENDENVTDAYYFLEGNADFIENDGDFILVEMDTVKFVLIDLGGGTLGIAVEKKYSKHAEQLLID